MCEQTEIIYLDGEVVWVKLGSCWWPGEVVASEKLPPDVLRSFRKPPIAVVKFFQEDTYEYVKNINSIYKYNCSRKDEFIKKGLYMYRTKHGHMEKFPEDIIRAESVIGGDVDILTREEFQEPKKESYAGLFGDPKKTPSSLKKGKSGRGRPPTGSPHVVTPFRKIKEKTDYKVHILVQGSKSAPSTSENSEVNSTPSTSGIDLSSTEDKAQGEDIPQTEEKSQNEGEAESNETSITTISTPSTPVTSVRSIPSSSGIYACHACPFSTTRLNVLILHNKTHSVSFIPYTPSPIRKKPISKSSPKPTSNSKTPKPRKARKEKVDKADKPPKKLQAKKRASEEKTPSEIKKAKTDEEIKSSLLADWDDDDIEDESNDESSAMVSAQSPEVPVGAESPAVPTPAELPSAQVPAEISIVADKKSSSSPSTEKPESSSDSKYEFCEDEDWPEEADIGRKIPRVKNPIRTDDTKSVSIDEDEVAREVAELLNKTALPELPSVPEPLKIEENFPEPSIVKSPDKNQDKSRDVSADKGFVEVPPSKAIFKTKTFFRSRHSRSQDAIGKYVAEQLNAVEKMDIADSEINGSEAVSSPEARDSPPIEPVKVAKLAPKIQLKKMKAEAAQLREREKMNTDQTSEMLNYCQASNTTAIKPKNSELPPGEQENHEKDLNESSSLLPTQEVFYPLQEIKPVNSVTGSFAIEVDGEQLENNDAFMEEESSKMEETSFDREEKETQKLDDVTTTITEETSKCENEPSKLPTEDSHKNNKNSESEENHELTTKLLESSPSENEELSKETSLNETSQDHQLEPYMNESTASAVDALLSVSREVDRVPRVVSNDLPEDLFEDDNKDSETTEVNSNFNENIDSQNSFMTENGLEKTQEVEHIEDIPKQMENTELETSSSKLSHNEGVVDTVMVNSPLVNEEDTNVSVVENVPSESDLQIAETLLNLPSTAIQSQTEHKDNVVIPFPFENESSQEELAVTETVVVNNKEVALQDKKEISEIVENADDAISNTENDSMNTRFETEQEKSENLNAAQSLVEMSESIEHKINIVEQMDSKDIIEPSAINVKASNGTDTSLNSVEQSVALLSSDNNRETVKSSKIFEQSSSKLLKILEEPCKPKFTATKSTPKQIIMQGKEKILNFDVAKSTFKSKTPKQKIIIRRTAATPKTVLNNVNELAGPEKIILSRSGNPSQDGSAVQTYTIQTSPDTPSDSNTIIIQQKIRKISKPAVTQPKLQKIKPQLSLVAPVSEVKSNPTQSNDDVMFDINSMPIVLSEDLLTPESIEKMPVVMSDANIISQSQSTTKVIKSKTNLVEQEKVAISTTPHKPEVKTLLLNPASEVTKSITPNILSKSSKLRGAKPMLVIDKTTGKQKIIMTKSEPTVKEIKQASNTIQPTPQAAKTEKFILLPTQSASPRPARTQKIVIDPQTGKAHVFVAKGSEAPLTSSDNKPVSAKLVPSNSDASAPGNTVMIITNAQGAQSRIVLTPEHEKILFPNKQQPNVSQLKSIAQRITSTPAQKTVTSQASVKTQAIAPVKAPARIVPKQKSAIITSKGQLIVGGRVATTAQNIAPMPELRPVTKRIVTSEPKKLTQAVQKSNSEPIIFLQQKSGAVMQLTAAQFEHLQRTGQIVKSAAPVQEKIVIQKVKPANDPGPSIKPRARKPVTVSPTPTKKIKHEIAIAPAPPLPTLMPALAPATNIQHQTLVPSASNTISVASTSSYSEFDNFEELLPSTAIARQTEPVINAAAEPVASPAPAAAAPPAALSDGQLLAVPGEHFGGPVGTFYLCVEDNGTFTPIDNRPLVLENNQLVPMIVEPAAPQPERRDILEAALANSDVFHADSARDDAPDFRDLNANVSVHCRVSETSTTLNQPIMTPVEMPTKADSEPAVPSNLEDGLAVIGVTPHSVPTSLELPITVTDPRIAPKTTDPLSNNNYGAALLPSPGTELFAGVETAEVGAGPISMPLLTEEEPVGKSMPLLTDEGAEHAASSLGSAGGSPCSLEVREEPDDGAHWARRLLTPGSDTSEASAEIPLQPAIQLSVGDMDDRS